MPDDSNDLETLTKAVAANPNDHRSWYDLGTLVDKMADDPEEAAFYYTNALSLAPFNLHYHNALVALWIDYGCDDLALETLDFASDLLRDPEDLDNSQVFALYAEAGLHSLHAMDLDLTRSILERVAPDDIRKTPDLMRVALAYAELHMANLELEQNISSDRIMIHSSKLPSPRLNPARYYKATQEKKNEI